MTAVKCQLCPACFCLNSHVYQGVLRESIPASVGTAVYVLDAPQLPGVPFASVLCGGCLSGLIFVYCVQILPFFCITHYSPLTLIPPTISLSPFQVSRHMPPLGTLNYPQILKQSNLWHAIKWPSGRETSWESLPPRQHLYNNSHSFIQWMFICADGSWEEINYGDSVVFLDTARLSFHQTDKVSEKHFKVEFLSQWGSGMWMWKPGHQPQGGGLTPSRTPGTSFMSGVEVGEQSRQIQM